MVQFRTMSGGNGEAGSPLFTLRRVAVICAVFALIIATLLWRSVEVDYQHALAGWNARLSTAADDRQTWSNEWLAERLADAEVVARFRAVATALRQPPTNGTLAALPAEEAEHIQRDVAATLASGANAGIVAIDRSGRIAFAEGSIRAPAAALAAIAANPQPAGDLTIDGRAIMVFAAPVSGDDTGGGAPLGWVLLLVDPEQRLWPLLTQQKVLTKTGEVVVARREGDHLVFLSPLRLGDRTALGRVPADTPSLAASAAIAGRTGFGELLDYRGTRVLAATRPLGIPGWGLVQKVDYSEAFAEFDADVRRSILLAVVATIAFAAIMLSLNRRQQALALRSELVQERRLRSVEERYRHLLDEANDIMLVIATDNHIIDANQRAEEAYGYARDELLSLTVSDLRAADTPAPPVADVMARAAASGIVLESLHRRKDGTTFPVESSLRGIETDTGRLFIAAIRDITDRRHAEDTLRRLNAELEQRVRERTAKLEAANAELSSFNYSVSHDLRAPLRHIEGFIRILEEDYAGQLPPEGRHYLERVRAGSVRINQLIDALLRLVRIGRAEMHATSVNLGELTRATFDELRQHDNDHPVELVIGNVPRIAGDPVLIRELLDNLLGNALKFTRPVPAARIELGVQHRDGQEVFYVRDNGVGFDPAHSDRLFRVFQRLHSRDAFEGTGIGLSIVKRIVEKHGGHIWADSTPGNGATFYFTLRPEEG